MLPAIRSSCDSDSRRPAEEAEHGERVAGEQHAGALG
jgi:hypothetical protein